MNACLPLPVSRLLRLGVLFVTTAGLLTILPAPGAVAAAPSAPVFDHGTPRERAPGLNEPEAISPYRKRVTGVRRMGAAPAQGAQATAISGAAWIPVILADFSDNVAEATLHSPAAFNDMLFRDGYAAGAGSLRDFYQDQSGGLFDITGGVTSWLRLSQSYGSYVGSDAGRQTAEPNVQTFVRDAVIAADASVDFCRGDSNGDGYVDSVSVVHAGPGAEEGAVTSRLWSVKWSLPSAYTTQDVCTGGQRAKVWKFTVEPEEFVSGTYTAPGAPDRLVAIGVFCHELGHILGLPDLYDTDSSSSGGVGGWDLMANGSWGLNGNRPWRPTPFGAWSKTQLGWALPSNQTQPASRVSIPSIDATHTGAFSGIYRLARDGSATSLEYFLVENRQPVGFAADFPNGGLAVWHIDDSVPGNNNDARRRVTLLQADGLDELGGPRGARPDAGDLYPGSALNRSLTGTSTPNTRSFDGAATGVAVTSIGDPGSVTLADLAVTIPPPAPDLSVTIQAPGSAFVGDDSSYTVSVWNRNAPANGVTLTLTPPAGAVLVSASGSNATCSGAGPVTCTLGTVNAGTARTLTFVATPTRAGTGRLTADVRSIPADATASDNIAGADVVAGGRTCTWIGTQGADIFAGTAGIDVACGLGGNDGLGGGAGADTLYGGSGHDTLAGGASDDLLDGGDGIDTITYAAAPAINANMAYSAAEGRVTGEGTDRLLRSENLTGSSSSDVIAGSDAANVLAGGAGDDTIRGGDGEDTIAGDDGYDWLYGEAGDDIVLGLAGLDLIDGGAGTNDLCRQGETIELLVSNCEQ